MEASNNQSGWITFTVAMWGVNTQGKTSSNRLKPVNRARQCGVVRNELNVRELERTVVFEFVFGVIVGAVFGVFADRIWQYFENRPRFRITTGWFTSMDLGGCSGVTLSVENAGWGEIPEYHISIFHPDRGNFSGFCTEGESQFPQLPDQVNRFRWVTAISGTGVSSGVESWVKSGFDGRIRENQNFQGFELRIVLKNGERVLYSHSGLGNTLTKNLCSKLPSAQLSPGDCHYASNAFWFDESLWKRKLRKQMDQAMASSAINKTA